MLLIPAGQPPLKDQTIGMASAADRLAMCRLAANGATKWPAEQSNLTALQPPPAASPVEFDVSDIEITTDGPSYTLTTARRLREQGMTQIHWLIGADQLNSLPRWHEPEALVREVNFIVMARPGYELNWSALPRYMQHLRANVVSSPHLDISATNIRRRVAAGLPIDWLTPPAVADYIRLHPLYRDTRQ